MLAADKIKNKIILIFILFLVLGIVSEASAKLVAVKPPRGLGSLTATSAPSNPFYSKTSNDLTAYLGRKDSNSPYVRYQKDDNYLEFSLNNQAESVSLETNSQEPNTPTLFYRNILPDTDVAYQITNLPFTVKEEIVLKQSQTSNLKTQNYPPATPERSDGGRGNSKQKTEENDLTFTFSASTNTSPQKQQDGSINFYDQENNYLFQLDKPFMYDAKGIISNDVKMEIVPVESPSSYKVHNVHKVKENSQKTKTTSGEMVFGALTGARSELVNYAISIFKGKFLSSIAPVDISKVLEARGFEPLRHELTSSVLQPAAPRTNTLYTIILSADSNWLNDPSRVYPVIIDPTITHNADSNFTGQHNRTADSDSTSSTQIESSYGENANDPYTVLNIHFNETSGSTNIKDYASPTRVITANGNASTTNYVTQLGMGNSGAFDGNGDYLSLADSEDWSYGSGDFSIDFWVRFNMVTANQRFYDHHVFGTGNLITFNWEATNTLYFYAENGGIVYANYRAPFTPSINTWYHISLVRNGNNVYIFVNGVSLNLTINTAIGTLPNISDLLRIGQRSDGAGPLNGYLDEFRILKGRALTPEEIKAAASRRPYAVYTSPTLDASVSVQWNTLSWTEGGVNTGNGEQPYSTNSLVAQWDFNDTSGATLTASSSGSCTTSCNGTLTNFASTGSQDAAAGTGWTANNKRWGAGALMFDGSNDYVSVADNDGWNFGSGDFSMEIWVRFNTVGTSQILFDHDGAGNARMYLYFSTTNGMSFRFANSASTVDTNQGDASGWSAGVWYYVTVVRNGSNINVYRNGISIASNTISIAGDDMAATLQIGRNSLDSDYFNGLLDSLRIYKGRALSAAEILSNYNAGNVEIQTRTGASSDPNDGTWEAWKPTTGETQLLSMDSDQGNWNAPQQIDGYTKLLLHMDGTDAATTFPNSATTTHTVTRSGDAQVDTAQSKFGGSSGLFDGTGDYLSIPDSDDWHFGGGDFTIDFWVKPNATAEQTLLSTNWTGGSASFEAQLNSSNKFKFIWTTTGSNGDASDCGFTDNAIATGKWTHVSIVRNSTTLIYYIDGTNVKSCSIGTDVLYNSTESLTVGSRGTGLTFNGWIDELRISKGIARWTSNFTPPPRPYTSNVKAENETTIKQEGTASTKLTLGAPQIDGNTVALWRFEETGTTTGTYLYDETANNNDATTTGTTVVDGIFGKARKFNGTSDYASAADSDNWNFGSGDFTIDGWFYFNNLSGTQNFLSQYTNSTTRMNFYKYSAGFAMTFYYGGVYKGDYSTNVLPSQNSWHHIAFVRNGSSAYIYLDGISQAITVDSAFGSNDLGNYSENLVIGSMNSSNYFNGYLDSFRILKGRALSPDEIAETYRMGANHHLTRQVSSNDMSSANKLTFNIAGDRPGAYLEAMLGESDYANYELASSTAALSTNTVLYIKGDEIASSTSIKDSSFSGKTITANGNARTSGMGKIGNSVYFDGTGDYLRVSSASDWKFLHGAEDTTGFKWSYDAWVKINSFANRNVLIATNYNTAPGLELTIETTRVLRIEMATQSGGVNPVMSCYLGSDCVAPGSIAYPNDSNWHHVAVTYDQSLGSNNMKWYIDGVMVGAATKSANTPSTSDPAHPLSLGEEGGQSWTFNGYMDEVRISKDNILTADQIRQAYEYGLRSHQVTIDFGASLQPSDLISNSTDYNFSLTATTSGLSATTSGLYLGDKIIIKENRGGTEYTAQGAVNAINTATGAITVPSWDSGSSFPSGGFTQYATVFKWQREYFDLTGAATTTRNAITNLTLRPTNGAGGRTVYLDDFRYNTNYLTASSSSAITSSNNRYLQYRVIFSSWDSFVSPFLSAISTAYTSTANMFPPNIGFSGGGFLSF